jgi:hypothetical protein
MNPLWFQAFSDTRNQNVVKNLNPSGEKALLSIANMSRKGSIKYQLGLEPGLIYPERDFCQGKNRVKTFMVPGPLGYEDQASFSRQKLLFLP